MKIKDIMVQRRRGLSFEFFPPRDEKGERQLYEAIRDLERLNPTFVSVTRSARGSTYTRFVVARIKAETSLTPMPHITCLSQSKDELHDTLEDYINLGIENILALRGDIPQDATEFTPPKDSLCYARELVEFAASFHSFCIGVAVYPEGHLESPNLELDMMYTKQKIDAGADFAITQMFFNNRFFYNFLDRAEKARIHIPIIPGIMPITNVNSIRRLGQRCGATLPELLMQRMEEASTEDVPMLGIEFATKQCADLLQNNNRYFHFYTMNQSKVVAEIVNNLNLGNSC